MNKSTVEELSQPLIEIRGALRHNKQFETDFEVACILAALKKWETGIGK